MYIYPSGTTANVFIQAIGDCCTSLNILHLSLSANENILHLLYIL